MSVLNQIKPRIEHRKAAVADLDILMNRFFKILVFKNAVAVKVYLNKL